MNEPARFPGYWRNEKTAPARAVRAYLAFTMQAADIVGMRAYLRQWIMAPVWGTTPGIEDLRRRIDGLESRKAISRWLDDALSENIDPL